MSNSNISKDDQQEKPTLLVEVKIKEFKEEINEKCKKINDLERKELEALTTIAVLSNEIKEKSNKIVNFESNLSSMTDIETGLSVKELKVQNENQKIQLEIEMAKH